MLRSTEPAAERRKTATCRKAGREPVRRVCWRIG